MSTSQIYLELQLSRWNTLNPNTCPCRGSGWLLSDYDTWHRCVTHGHNVPHPEDDSESSDAFDFKAHRLNNLRVAYATFRDIARRNGFVGDFKAACQRALDLNPTPQAWVDAAEHVAESFRYDAEENAAHAAGYSCGLEARLAGYAAEERWERYGK